MGCRFDLVGELRFHRTITQKNENINRSNIVTHSINILKMVHIKKYFYDKSGHFVFFPDFRGKIFSLSVWSMMLTVSIDTFYRWRLSLMFFACWNLLSWMCFEFFQIWFNYSHSFPPCSFNIVIKCWFVHSKSTSNPQNCLWALCFLLSLFAVFNFSNVF